MRQYIGTLTLVAHMLVPSVSAQIPARLGIQLSGQLSSGWTVEERDQQEQRITPVSVSTAAGVGAQLSYDFVSWGAGYAGLNLDAEREGVYWSYSAGVLLRPPTGHRVRWHARIGSRLIDVVAPLWYADLGLGADLPVGPALELSLAATKAVPLGEGSRFTGTHTVAVSPRSGPHRFSLGVTWRRFR